MPNRPSIPAKVKRKVRREAGHRCANCGATDSLDYAHIVDWSQSKDHSAQNLLCLCVKCHRMSHEQNWGVETLRHHKQNPWIYIARPAVTSERQELLRLLDTVEKTWVEGLLETSVPEERRIALEMKELHGAVEVPGAVLEKGLETPAVLSGEKILNLFQDRRRELLILGDTGSGKTTTLLQLAEGLIDQAWEGKSEEPIPVYLRLSSWAERKLPLEEWLVQAMGEFYSAADKAHRSWLPEHRILPLLDGLDEVEAGCQAACVEKINDWADRHGFHGIAVCCHTRVYEALPRLKLAAAVALQPLTQVQIDEYAAKGGPEGERLREVLAGDEGLRELAETPRLLHLIEDICTDGSGGKTLAESTGAPLEDRRRTLLKNYVDAKLKESPPSPYSPEQTLRSLAWLARQMKDRSSSLFQLEQLQPSWLPMLTERWVYFILTRALAGALLMLPAAPLRPSLIMVGIVAGALTGLFDIAWTGQRRQGAAGKTGRVILYAVVAFFPFFFSFDEVEQSWLYGLPAALLFGLVFGLRSAAREGGHDIRVAEALTWAWWSWKGAALGAITGGIAGMIPWLAVGAPPGFLETAAKVAGFFLLAGAPVGYILGCMKREVIPKKPLPNLGIRLTLKKAAFLFLAVFLGISLVSGAVVLALREWQPDIPLWVPFFLGSLLGLAVALGFSGLDFLQHFVLRAFLCLRGYTPARYVDFLDYAADCGLLHKAGGSYLFRYGRPLLKHFASLFSSTPQTRAPSANTGAPDSATGNGSGLR